MEFPNPGLRQPFHSDFQNMGNIFFFVHQAAVLKESQGDAEDPVPG